MKKRVLILGGGIIGLSAAWHAMRRGFEVTVVDRGGSPRAGCSFGNAGMVVPSHFVPLAAPGAVWQGLKWMWNPESPFYIRPRLSLALAGWSWRFWRASTAARVRAAAPVLRDLNLASRAIYEEWAAYPAAGPGDFGLQTKGLLMLCRTAHGLEEEAQAAARANELGVPARVLDATAAQAMDPAATLSIEGAVFYPRDCHLDPSRLMAGLEASLQAGGAKLLFNTDITGLLRDGKNLSGARSNHAEFRADQVVLAAGSWSPQLARELGLKIPMQAGKGYSLTLPDPRQLPGICSILTEARVAVTPMGGRLRVGGTMELSGMSEAIAPARVRGIVRSFCQYYPCFNEADFTGIEPWHGLRPCSPDGLPYLGRSEKIPNLVIATGHAMMGLSLGPVTGSLVGQLLDGEKPGIGIELLRPGRYG
ncbi:MAG: FAD-dependent oxidoreductase [Planctomycetota bacterium]|nr:FAD-dependent oxidoreductase [Planctomycetota bacterium]RLS40412.1 MAG: FAD-dependent oxidoreductase [Planctomycetota bacterium]